MSFNGSIEVSCSESDFYQRKVIRLEDNITLLHEELAKLRIKLRTAQDFQIKYHILLKTTEDQIAQIKKKNQEEIQLLMKERLEEKIKQNNLKWEKSLRQLQQTLKNQADKELRAMKEERDDLHIKNTELNLKKQESDIFNLKIKKLEKQSESLQQQIDQQRALFQKRKEEEINNLRTHLNSSYRQRIENERKKYENQIALLQKKLTEQEILNDQQLFKIPTSNCKELSALKQLLEDESYRHKQEMQELQSFLQQKNRQIKELLLEKDQQNQKYSEEVHHRESIILQLESTLLEKEKEHQEELTNAITKLNQLKNKQVTELTAQIQELRKQGTNQKKWWSSKLIHHDEQFKNLTEKYEEEIKRLNDTKHELKEKIVQLTQRLKQHEGDKAVGDTEQLIASMNDLEQKKNHMSNYQDGITFLEGQLSKCQRKLEQKTRALLAANKEVSLARAEAAQQSALFIQKINNLKRQFSVKVVQLQKQIGDLNQHLRLKQQQMRQFQRDKATLANEKQLQAKKLKYDLQQVQRDYKRVMQSNKQNKSIISNNQKSSQDKSSARKRKWLQLQKQRIDLECTFRCKQEQQRLLFEKELDQKDSLLTELRRKIQITEKQRDLLQDQNKKLKEEIYDHKENNTINKYQNKLATINLELALGNNIYQQLARIKRRREEEETKLQEKQEKNETNQNKEPLILSIDPTSFKKNE